MNVVRSEVQQSTSNQAASTNNTMSSSSSGVIGSSVEKQSAQLVNNDRSEGGASSFNISRVFSVTVDTSSSSLHNHIEEVAVVDKPKFFFTPVNRFGCAVNELTKLEDTGMYNIIRTYIFIYVRM